VFNSLFSTTAWVSQQQKGKPFWIYWSKSWWGSSGISWTICKSFAPRSKQITTPVPHHSVFTGRMPFLPPNQQHQSAEDTKEFKESFTALSIQVNTDLLLSLPWKDLRNQSVFDEGRGKKLVNMPCRHIMIMRTQKPTKRSTSAKVEVDLLVDNEQQKPCIFTTLTQQYRHSEAIRGTAWLSWLIWAPKQYTKETVTHLNINQTQCKVPQLCWHVQSRYHRRLKHQPSRANDPLHNALVLCPSSHSISTSRFWTMAKNWKRLWLHSSCVNLTFTYIFRDVTLLGHIAALARCGLLLQTE